MIEKILQRLLRNRFWKTISLNELSELYISSLFKNLATSLMGIFVPVYLYLLGYSATAIFFYLATIVFSSIPFNFIGGYLVTLTGPKHTLLISYWLKVTTFVLLLTLPQVSWPLWLLAMTWGSATGLYFVAYRTDFSAIEHSDREGRELGFLGIAERLGGVLGPLVGGLVATFIGAEYAILAAIFFFVMASVPLMLTKEPITKKNKLVFKNLPIDEIKKHTLAIMSFGVEKMVTIMLWPFYIAIFIFTDNVYVSVGLIISLSFLASIVITYAIGKFVDKRKGGLLLKWGASLNFLIHLARPFVQGFQGVLALSMVKDSTNPAYKMPFLKGLYDSINLHSRSRVEYVVVHESISAFAEGCTLMIIGIISIFVDAKIALIVGFVIASFASLGLMTHKFKTLKNN